MQRAVRIYIGSFLLMVAAFALAARLSDTDYFAYALPRFCLRALGVGAAIVSWRAAVHMASVHRRVWPLALATAGVVLSCTAALWMLAG